MANEKEFIEALISEVLSEEGAEGRLHLRLMPEGTPTASGISWCGLPIQVYYRGRVGGREEGFSFVLPEGAETEKALGMSYEAAVSVARGNTLAEACTAPFNPGAPVEMSIISNRMPYEDTAVSHGAAAVLSKDVLYEASISVGGGPVYLLPSSKHEFLVVSKETGTLEKMARMVRDINRQEVKEEDRLSDDVFLFDPADGGSVRRLTLNGEPITEEDAEPAG